MSAGNVVDSKIVELQFNNKDFESNATKSLSTLDRLKAALNFSKGAKGFDEISDSVKKVDVGGLTSGINTLKGALGELAHIAAFAVIADEAIKAKEAVKGFIEDVTVKQVSAGWDKYAQKTTAVQTIMAATEKDFENVEEQMAAVNEQLDKLNWFTDETSYNFLDMVSNIGKFTSNRVPLDQSVTAMEGISTWAAKSGANITEASRAMYNLSQAIAVGSVKLIDWKSIENANMATAEFKETAIQTAVELGTLVEAGDGLYKTLDGHEVSVKNFNENLKDAWFSSEVLLETLSKYGSFTDKLNGAMEKIDYKATASDMISFVEDFKKGELDVVETAKDLGVSVGDLKSILNDLSDDSLDFGLKAFKAAQEAKTFGEAIASVKDAVSTGWMNTFETVFGDYEQAKVLWTDVANGLWDIFASGAEARNKYLADVFQGTKAITQADWDKLAAAGIAGPEFLRALRAVAREHGETITALTKDEETLRQSIDDGLISFQWVQEAFEKINETGKKSSVGIETGAKSLDEYKEAALGVIRGDYTNDMEKRFEMLNEKGFDAQKVQEYVTAIKDLTGGTWDVNDSILEEAASMVGLTDALDSISGSSSKAEEALNAFYHTSKTEKLEDLFDPTNFMTGTELLAGTLTNALSIISETLDLFKEVWDETFDGLDTGSFHDILADFYKGSESILEFIKDNEQLKNVFRGVASAANIVGKVLHGVFSTIGKVGTVISDALGFSFLDVAEAIANAVTSIDEFLSKTGIIGTIGNTIANGIGTAVKAVKGFIDAFLNIPIVQNNIERFKTAFTTIFGNMDQLFSMAQNGLSRFIKAFNDNGGFKELGIIGTLKLFKEQFLDFVGSFKGFRNLKNAFSGLFGDISDVLSDTATKVKTFFDSLIADLDGTFAGKALGFVSDAITSVISLISDLVGGRFSLDTAINTLKNLFTSVIDIFGKIPWNKVLFLVSAIAPFVAIGIAIKKLIDIIMPFPKLINSVSDTISSVGEAIKPNKLQKNANALKTFAIAIGILAASVFVLSGIEPAKLWMAVGAIAALAAILLGISFALSKMDKVKGLSIGASASLLAISLSVLVLVAALKSLQDLDNEHLVRNLAILAGLLAAMVGVAFVLSKLNTKLSIGVLGILAFVLAVKMLVGVLKDIDALELKNPLQSLGILTALMLGLAVCSRIASSAKAGSGAAMLLSAASIFLVAKALENLGNIRKDKLNKALIALGVITACLAALNVANGFAKPSIASGFATLLNAGAFLVLTKCLEQLAAIPDPSSLENAEVAIGVLTACLGALNAINGVFNPDILSSLATLLNAGALWVITDAFTSLAALSADSDSLANAEIAIAVLTGCLAALNAVDDVFKPDMLSGLTTVVNAGALWIATNAAKTLAEIPDSSKLDNAEVAIGVLTACLGALNAIDSVFNPNMLTGLTTVVNAGALLIATQAAKELAGMPEGSNLEQSKETIIALTGCLAGLNVIDGVLNPNPLSGLASLVNSGALLLVTQAVSQLASIDDPEKLSQAKETIEVLTGCIAALNAINAVTGGSGLATMGTILGVLGILVLVFAAISAVFSAFGGDFQSFIQKGVDALVTLGEGIGRFAGSIVSSGAEEALSHFPQIAEYIKQFMDTMAEVKPVDVDSIGAFFESVTAVLTVSFAGCIDALLSAIPEMVSGKSAAEQFADDLMVLAEAIERWQDAMNRIGGHIDVPTDALTELSTIIEGINFDGFFSAIGGAITKAISGKTQMEAFAADVGYLAEAITDWQTAMSNLDGASSITVDYDGITALADLISNIDFTSFFSAIGSAMTKSLSGKTQMEAFSADVGYLAEAISEWQTAMSSLDEGSNITVDYNGITALADLISNIDFTSFFSAIGGAITKAISGKTQMEAFAADVGYLTEAIDTWQTAMSGLDSSATSQTTFTGIESIADAIHSINFTSFFDAIGSAITKALSGKTQMEAFAADIGYLSEAVVTWHDAMENIGGEGGISVPKDEIGELVTVIDAIGTDSLTEAIGKKITEFISAKDDIEEFKEKVEGLASALNVWKDQTEGLGDGFTVDGSSIEELIAAIESVPKTGGIVSAIESFFEGTSDLEKFSGQLELLGGGLKSFTDALGKDIDITMLTESAEAAKVLGEIGNVVKGQDFGGWFHEGDLTNFSSDLSDLGEGLKTLSEYDMDTAKLSEMASAARNLAVFAHNIEGVNISDSDLNTLSSSIDELKTATDKANTIKLSGDIMNSGKIAKFKENINSLISAINSTKGMDDSKVSDFVNAVDKMSSASIKEVTQETPDVDLSSSAESAGNSYAEGITNSAEAVTGAIQSLSNAALASAMDGAGGFNSAGFEIVSQMILGVTQGMSSFVGAVGNTVEAAISTLGNYQSSWYNAGYNFVTGLANGITQNRSAAINAAIDVAVAALNAAKNKLGEHSPSRKMYQVGAFFVEGFVNGIKKTSFRASSAAASLAKDTLDSFNGVTKAVYDILNADIDSDPVIRPVIDLTSVDEGARKLNGIFNKTPRLAIAGNVGYISSNAISNRNAATNADILEALEKLGDRMGSPAGSGNTYYIDGITYDDGTNVSNAVRDLVRAVKVGGRM